MKHFVIALLACLNFSVAFGQTQLTSMINSTNGGAASSPSNFVEYKGKVIFITMTREGQSLWSSDGTAGGTQRVKDIAPGVNNSISSNLVLMRDKIYFIANDGINDYQLWETDGTEAGTKAVTSKLNRAASQLVTDGNRLFFITTRSSKTTVIDLWVSDGTATGTTPVKQNISIYNSYLSLTMAGGKAYFGIWSPGDQSYKVWVSDGTANGTLPVSGDLFGTASTGNYMEPAQFVDFNGSLYFVGDSSPYANLNAGIMKTDGTLASTSVVKEIEDGVIRISFARVTVHNGKLYFLFFDLSKNRIVIWESGGSTANTSVILDQTFPSYFAPSDLVGQGNYLYFTLGNAANGTSLVKFDLSSRTFTDVKEVAAKGSVPGIIYDRSSASVSIKPTKSGKLYIKATNDNTGKTNFLWLSDGTTLGTVRLNADELVGAMMVVNERLYYWGAINFEGELWKSDGTAATTVLVKEINASSNSTITNFIPVSNGKQLLFSGNDADNGIEPWTTDGAIENTHILGDMVAGKGSSDIWRAAVANDSFVFIGAHPSGRALYKSDGTMAGTTAVRVIGQTDFPGVIKAGKDGNTVYFTTFNLDWSCSLYKTDLTTNVTVELIRTGDASYFISENSLETGDSYVYLLTGGSARYELWRTDGTVNGTVKIDTYSIANNLSVVGNTAYFNATPVVVWPATSDYRSELFKSDGTYFGTGIVKNLNGNESPNITPLGALGSKLLFVANGEDTGRELWITDGTAGGTTMVKDIYTGINSGVLLTNSVVKDGMLYFTANDGEHGAELWKTDGTSQGTTMVRDLAPGAESSKPTGLTLFVNTIYFSAFAQGHGFELAVSDGTVNGTKMLMDVVEGPAGSYPSPLAMIDGVLLFSAMTESQGRQLWSFDPNTITTIEPERVQLSIYPNPSTGEFRLTVGHDKKGQNVEVFNLDGMLLQKTQLVNEEQTLNLTSLPTGVYVIKISDSQGQHIRKVVKL